MYGMDLVGMGLALVVQTMRLVWEWEESRVDVDIGCSYGAVNVGVTADKPRSRKGVGLSVCLFA